jgi:hypothetical protein
MLHLDSKTILTPKNFYWQLISVNLQPQTTISDVFIALVNVVTTLAQPLLIPAILSLGFLKLIIHVSMIISVIIILLKKNPCLVSM